MLIDLGKNSGATFSDCRTYRYVLWRQWEPEAGFVAWIGLNPSTADETKDDPTIRRCIRFAKDWGYGGIYMLNLFAFRATKPADMKAAEFPVGAMNDTTLVDYAKKSQLVIAAWGFHGDYLGRAWTVTDFLPVHSGRVLHCLGTTKDGHPKHPLYVPAATRAVPYVKS